MSESTEHYVLEKLVPELEAEGYEVFLQPGPAIRPGFLKDFIPDALALGKEKNLVVEVFRESREATQKLAIINALLRDREGWELRSYWVSPTSESRTLEIQGIPAIRERVDEVRQLAATDHRESALLIAWATFEALGRVLMPSQFGRPQTPGRLLEVLASNGYLTPIEAETARALVKKRNSLIHGELQLRVSEDELKDISAILDNLLEQAQEGTSVQA